MAYLKYRKNRFILVLFLLIFSCTNSNERIIEKYPDGSKKKTIIIINDSTGIIKSFYKNGSVFGFAEMKYSKLNGVKKNFAKDGKIIYKGRYKSGIKIDTHHYYYDNDSPMIIKIFNKTGEAHGKWKYYYKGNLTNILYYQNDSLIWSKRY